MQETQEILSRINLKKSTHNLNKPQYNQTFRNKN